MIFTTQDPQGRSVALSEDTWDGHVVSGHPEMIGQENAVLTTIESPDVIYKSSTHPNSREVFFTLGTHSRYKGVYTKVVVEYSSQVGAVITAMASRKIDGVQKEGGILHVKTNSKI